MKVILVFSSGAHERLWLQFEKADSRSLLDETLYVETSKTRSQWPRGPHQLSFC